MTFVDEKIRCLLMSLPDDIQMGGWSVAVHNDYRLNGKRHTFWLFTRTLQSGITVAVKGEGESNAVALNAVRAEIYKFGWNTLTDGFISDPKEPPGG